MLRGPDPNGDHGIPIAAEAGIVRCPLEGAHGAFSRVCGEPVRPNPDRLVGGTVRSQPRVHATRLGVPPSQNTLDGVRYGASEIAIVGMGLTEFGSEASDAGQDGRHVLVGRQVVGDDNVGGNAGRAQQQGHRDTGAVLARRTVQQHRTRRGRCDLQDLYESLPSVAQNSLIDVGEPGTLVRCDDLGVGQQGDLVDSCVVRLQRVCAGGELSGTAEVDDGAGRSVVDRGGAGVTRRGQSAAVEHSGPGHTPVGGGESAEVAEVGENLDVGDGHMSFFLR